MKKLAIFFPGIGYHCDKPLLYYARKLTQECGYEESISLSYSYDGRNIRGDEQKMQRAFEALYAQAEQQLDGMDFGKYFRNKKSNRKTKKIWSRIYCRVSD